MRVSLDLNKWESHIIYTCILGKLYDKHCTIDEIRDLLVLHDKAEKVRNEIWKEEKQV